MTKKILFSAILLLTVGITGCGRNCRDAREKVVTPVTAVGAYLQTAPSGAELQQSGCKLITDEFQFIPEGADTIRRIAAYRFSHTTPHCLWWETYYEQHCHYHHGHATNCWEVPRRRCAQWEYITHPEPGYAEAMKLAEDLDLMYAQAHNMCGQAYAGNTDAAFTMSTALNLFVGMNVQPEAQTTYARACGN